MLRELDLAMFEHFRSILSALDPRIDSNTMAFSLVEDERSDFLLMEKKRKQLVEIGEEDEARVKLPFAIVQRGTIEHSDSTNHGSNKFTTQNVVVSKDTGAGTARIVQAAPVDINYQLRIYHDNFGDLSDLLEFWLLNAGDNFTRVEFAIPEADNEEIEGNLSFEEPQPTRPTLDQSRSEGLVFSQTIPMKLRTTLIGDAETAKIILNNIHTIAFL